MNIFLVLEIATPLLLATVFIIDYIKSPKKLTREFLSKETGKKLELGVYTYINDQVILKNFKKRDEVLGKMNKKWQAIYSTFWLEAQVNNGGFFQYFYNSSQTLQNTAIKGYEELGLIEYAKLVSDAEKIAVLESNNREKLAKTGTKFNLSKILAETELNKYNEQFYALLEKQPSWEVRSNYIKKYLEEFVTLK